MVINNQRDYEEIQPIYFRFVDLALKTIEGDNLSVQTLSFL